MNNSIPSNHKLQAFSLRNWRSPELLEKQHSRCVDPVPSTFFIDSVKFQFRRRSESYRAVLNLLVYFSTVWKINFLKEENIARQLKISVRTVQKNIAQLKKDGLIATSRGYNTSNCYKVAKILFTNAIRNTIGCFLPILQPYNVNLLFSETSKKIYTATCGLYWLYSNNINNNLVYYSNLESEKRLFLEKNTNRSYASIYPDGTICYDG